MLLIIRDYTIGIDSSQRTRTETILNMMSYLNKLNYSFKKSHDPYVEEDNLIYSLLYASYICFFASLFLTNEFFLSYKIFLFVIIPLSIIPIYATSYRDVVGARRFKFELSYINPFKTLAVIRSRIFILVCIYGTVISISSFLYPSPSIGWFFDISKYCISILFFLAISSRISGKSSRSMEIFCALLTLIVTINATINMYFYFLSLPDFQSFSLIRFAPSFGRAPDHFPTTSALTYAIFLGISACLTIQIKAPITRFASSISGLILLSALILTQSRGPLVASLFTLLVISFFSPPRIRKSLVYLFGAIMSGFLLLPNIGVAALQRGENARLEVWNKFLYLASIRPVLGYGERIEFRVEIRGAEIIGHAHNLYISALIRGGIVASLSLLAAMLLGLKYSILFWKKEINFIPLSLIMILAIAGIVDFELVVFLADWQWPSIWLVLALIISCELSMIK